MGKRLASKYPTLPLPDIMFCLKSLKWNLKLRKSPCLCYVRYQSHKWTVYVRGATNEDLGAIIKRVVFQLHSSFNNPTRVVESPPFELSEAGWGEFEVAITLYFHSDVCDKPLNL